MAAHWMLMTAACSVKGLNQLAHAALIHSHEAVNGALCRCDGVMGFLVRADGLLFSCRFVSTVSPSFTISHWLHVVTCCNLSSKRSVE